MPEPLECLIPEQQRATASIRAVSDLLYYLAQVAERGLIVLAVDGVSASAAEQAWTCTAIGHLRSVLPTTSTTAWLSALTGADADAHLVPGLYFRVDGYPHPINVATTKAGDPWAAELIPEVPTVFQRLGAVGVQSVACLGGLTQFPGPWREAMLRGAVQVPSLGFPALRPDPEKAASAAIADIADTLARPGRAPLVFAYVDLDTSVHRRGYDDGVLAALHALDAAAHRWAREGVTVAAVSDHGLVPVAPSTAAMAAWRDLERSPHCRGSGGAGRMRWLYARRGSDRELFEEAEAALGEWADVHHFSALLLREPLRSRIGEVVAIARSPEFPLPASEAGWDHGAHTAEELLVPLALWGAPDGAALIARAVGESPGER